MGQVPSSKSIKKINFLVLRYKDHPEIPIRIHIPLEHTIGETKNLSS